MNNIVCLKHGNKYSADYVNTLHSMIKRNITVPYNFVCFTENTNGLNSDIETMPLPKIESASGWWYKPMFFNPNIGLEGTMLFIDLDVIIFRNIDNLFEYEPNQFCIIQDFNRYASPHWRRMNSSVFRLEIGTQSHVYEKYIKDPTTIIRRYHGDQDWIYSEVKEYKFWPVPWIQSYKWEMRDKPPMIRDKNGVRNFEKPGVPKILPNTNIAVFHGDPNPHNCIDPWCKEHWR